MWGHCKVIHGFLSYGGLFRGLIKGLTGSLYCFK